MTRLRYRSNARYRARRSPAMLWACSDLSWAEQAPFTLVVIYNLHQEAREVQSCGECIAIG